MSYQRIEIVDSNGVHVENVVLELAAGESKSVIVNYESDDTGTTGIGFKVNYDSVAEVTSTASLLHSNDNIAGGDVSDADGVTSHAFGYASLFGAFPGSGNLDLATVTLTNNSDSAVSIPVSLDFTSGNAGYELINGNPYVAPPAPLVITTNDIDENSGAGQIIASFEAVDGVTYSY
jgi:hypothetical protein